MRPAFVRNLGYLLLTRRDQLSEEHLPRLEAALSDNELLLKG